MTILTLVRHGTTEWMEEGRIHGRTDAPLSEVGLLQAEAAAEALRGEKFDAFYSSPIGRTMQTAEVIARTVHLQPVPLDELMEQDFGELEGQLDQQSYSPLKMLFYLTFFSKRPFGKGGESWDQLMRRGDRVLNKLARVHPRQSVLVVTHNGVINAILRQVTGSKFGIKRLKPCSISQIQVDAHRPETNRLLSLNVYHGPVIGKNDGG